MIVESGFKFPKEARKYNRIPYLGGIPILGRAFAGVGVGGPADYLLIPQLGTLAIGTVGYGWQATKAVGSGVAYGSVYVGAKAWQGASTVGQGVRDIARQGEYSLGMPVDWEEATRPDDVAFVPLLNARWRF
jgi:hypothetical protein